MNQDHATDKDLNTDGAIGCLVLAGLIVLGLVVAAGAFVLTALKMF